MVTAQSAFVERVVVANLVSLYRSGAPVNIPSKLFGQYDFKMKNIHILDNLLQYWRLKLKYHNIATARS